MRLAAKGRRTFSSLSIPNYRKYFFGQLVSLIGTWMQSTAQAWLVLDLTHSAADLGIVVGLQTLPTLLLGPYAGLVADRVDKRRLLTVLQGLMGLQALLLGILTLVGAVAYLDVCALAVVLGLNNAFENPTRQSFVIEMVGAADVRNAVTLNAILMNAARAVGPAIAGLLIATAGVGWCFIANALSFVAVVSSLVLMDPAALSPSPSAGRERGQLREGFAYVRRTPALLVPLAMMTVVGMLTFEFQVTLPLVARRVLHGSAVTYGLMTAAMGIGAILGGLVVATGEKTGRRPLVVVTAGFGVAVAAAALAPDTALELAALFVVGVFSVAMMSIGNATLQLTADPMMRGRVMSLWAVAFLGTTPIGGPLIGWISGLAGARVGLLVGALACAVAVGIAGAAGRRSVSVAAARRGGGPDGDVAASGSWADRAAEGLGHTPV